MALPSLPANHNEFIPYIAKHSNTPIIELIEPYKVYDAKVRELFAQEPDHCALSDPFVNVVPVFDGYESNIKIRARDRPAESQDEKERYIMPLQDEDRKPNGSPAVVQSLKEYQQNFNVFTELSLADLDWSNVVVAGSAAATALMPVPREFQDSKRSLRQYYHEILAPASDVDLFLYGLTEDEAKEKIKQIETKVRDGILQETTTIRTKHAITIASSYPIRHIQVVLRVYKSISEILTGFDVDCSCVCYDGRQVYMAPRALSSYMTQVNQIDLTRRSPSYENRLSKYSHRGFEVYWPQLDRSKIDPTIFERSFSRTQGLARLLIMEKLPDSQDRDAYMNRRRRERGRPEINPYRRQFRGLRGDIKNQHEDDVAEWVEQDEDVSDYHTFTIPYGANFNARKIEKLLYTKDLLLNAEWNKPKDREVHLHRHPAFFGKAEDVFGDCCGYCPKPITDDELEVFEKEEKLYVSGDLTFLKDDPGRQSIGSFNPITDQDWTEMAYVGSTTNLCAAIVDDDLDHVQGWLAQENADPNQRDHTGRTPLHLAVTCSTPQIVRCLVKNGSRLVARLADGRTALHLAAARGNVEIIKIIMERSERNEAEEEMKNIRRKDAKKAAQEKEQVASPVSDAESKDSESFDEAEVLDGADEDLEDGVQSVTTGSFVKIRSQADSQDEAVPGDDNEDEPDFYDVNVLSWDTKASPLHFAIVNGHSEVCKVLCEDFGADCLLPVKLLNDHDKSPRAAILTLVLALTLPLDKAKEMANTLLELGATSSQADLNGFTAFHYYSNNSVEAMLTLLEKNRSAALSALNHLAMSGNYYNASMSSPLNTAIENRDSITTLKLLEVGANTEVLFENWIKPARTAFQSNWNTMNDPEDNRNQFEKSVDQPIVLAVQNEMPDVVLELLRKGADPNTLPKTSLEILQNEYQQRYQKGESLLELVRSKIRSLREYKGEKGPESPPDPFKKDEDYLSDLENGSYKHWVAATELQIARKDYETRLILHKKRVKTQETIPGVDAKKSAVQDMIAAFEKVEHDLVLKGAKTFKELQPDIEEPTNGGAPYDSYEPSKPKPFEVKWSFAVGELTDSMKEQYLELFQAAWVGDLDKVRSLTLLPQGPGKKQPPLKIAVLDSAGFNPLSITVMRGHLECAKMILEITRAQFVPKDAPQERRYTLAHEDSDYSDIDGSNSDANPGNISSTLVNDTFTIDNIGEVSLQVKSHVTPLELLTSQIPNNPVTRFIDGAALPSEISEELQNQKNMPNSLFSYAILTDDLELLKFLLDLGEQYSSQNNDGEETSGTFFVFSEDDLEYSLKLGRTRHIAEILKRTGAGIPLEDLVKKSGIDLQEKPKYYQGLSFHGKKRADWANSGREDVESGRIGSNTPPLLIAAKYGNLEAVEFLLSDTPLRLYSEFTEANQDDKRLKNLSLVTEGSEAAISKWFGTRSDLLIHCVVIAEPNEQTDRLVSYLSKVVPSSLEHKSFSGQTPLHLAFQLGRKSLAEILINAGANQAVRDSNGNNLIHVAIVSLHHNKAGVLKRLGQMLDLLDLELRAKMFLQRNSSVTETGATPLHAFIQRHYSSSGGYAGGWEKQHKKALKLLLKYSKGEELGIINGCGDLPLHSLVSAKAVNIAKVLLDFNPKLLLIENAVGRTCAEIAQDQFISEQLAEPPQIVEQYYSRWNRQNKVGITDRDPEQFVPGKTEDKRSESGKMWDLIKEYMAKGDLGKRRLVSLSEANEITIRLGEMTKKTRANRRIRDSRGNESLTSDYEGRDEVTNWKGTTSWWAEYGDKDEHSESGKDEAEDEEGHDSEGFEA